MILVVLLLDHLVLVFHFVDSLTYLSVEIFEHSINHLEAVRMLITATRIVFEISNDAIVSDFPSDFRLENRDF